MKEPRARTSLRAAVTKVPPAPPVYRPPVVQRQAAPPVYRPPVVQRQAAPPVYRPPVVQRQAAPAVYRPAVVQRQAAPPVYRPVVVQRQSAPTVYRPGNAVRPTVQRASNPVIRVPMISTRAMGRSRTIQCGHDKSATGFTPMDLQNASFSTVTAMLYIDAEGDNGWACHGKFTSDANGHAEEHILTYLDTLYFGSGEAHVMIELTASPCGSADHNCAGQLMSYQKDGNAEQRGIEKISIKALGFYKGSADAKYDAGEILSTPGMFFEIWDVRTEALQGGAPEGYDNSASLNNFAQAEIFQEPKSGRKTSAFDKSSHNMEAFGKFTG